MADISNVTATEVNSSQMSWKRQLTSALQMPTPPPATLAPTRFYLPELDLIRLLAFLFVFLSHVVPAEPEFYLQAGIPGPVATAIVSVAAGGAFGVDLFFALSSFLITTLLLHERDETGDIHVVSFYLRRVLRIWPLYFTFLLILAPLVRMIIPGDRLPARDSVAFALLVGNWAFVAWGYAHSIVGPLWSVSVEEQFYLVWPALLRRFPGHLPGALLTVWVVSIATRTVLVLMEVAHPKIWCNTIAHLDPIACGGLLAVVFHKHPIAPGLGSRVALLSCAVAVFALAGHFGDFAGPRALVTYPGVAVASCGFIVASLHPKTDLTRHPLARPVLYLGKISYGLYVFHLMFITLLAVGAAHAPARRVLLICAAFLCSVIAATLSYQVLERPFLALKKRVTYIPSRPL
jgi:peptidoglycan/LPS O-acetylase OafA/YrhL